MPRENDRVATPIVADLLRGLDEIAAFIDESPHRTAQLIRRGELPAGRLGNEYIASRQRLRQH